MLRFKILVSVVPLMVAAILARVELVPGARPCIAVGDQSVQLASAPWHADFHVSFTDDPNAATQFIAISAKASGTAPVIYLTHEGPADYRIFVQSKTFTARDAAALIVGASGGHSRLTAASL